jgi:hypothetical protein
MPLEVEMLERSPENVQGLFEAASRVRVLIKQVSALMHDCHENENNVPRSELVQRAHALSNELKKKFPTAVAALAKYTGGRPGKMPGSCFDLREDFGNLVKLLGKVKEESFSQDTEGSIWPIEFEADEHLAEIVFLAGLYHYGLSR